MLRRVDHYSSLTRAVARLDRDSYAARGAVYDRAQKALEKRLSAADPPYSRADFEMEVLAFRYAVRRIEFGDSGADDDVLAAPSGKAVPGQAPRDSAAARSRLQVPDVDQPARPSVAGRVARRATFAAFVLAIGMVGYAVMTGLIALPQSTDAWPTTDPAGESTTPAAHGGAVAQQGIVYDDPPRTPNAVKAVGEAFWRTHTEPAGASGTGATVLELDLQVPQRHLAMRMTMRRAPAGDAMSHLMEIQFLREDGQTDADIANIGPPYMTTAEQTRSVALAAHVVRVTPGVFLVGLLGTGNAREQNERYLREQTWLDIPILYRGDVAGTLAIEKGAEGERIINETFDAWRR